MNKSKRDQKVLIEMLKNSSGPNDALRKAVKKYKANINSAR